MSTRLQITAFDLHRVKSWFGCHERELKTKLKRELDQQLQAEGSDPTDDEKQALIKGARARLLTVLYDGVVKSEQEETDGDVVCAYVLAKHAKANPQPWDDGAGEEEWQWAELFDMFEQFEKQFDDRTRTLLKYLIEGRALFGDGFLPDGNFYAYLSNDEANELSECMWQVYNDLSDLIESENTSDVEFNSDLLPVMESVLATLAKIDRHDIFVCAGVA